MSDGWSYKAGERPNTVVVYERKGSPNLYIRIWSSEKGNWVRRSLRHDDRQAAIEQAHEQHEKLRRGRSDFRKGRLTLERLFRKYRKHRSPQKSEAQQKVDEREVELWTTVLGTETEPHEISSAEWQDFKERRASGAIDARGNPVQEDKRRPVTARTVQIDCNWLHAVMNWAVKWKEDGEYLLDANPIRGFEAPSPDYTRRPVATEDQYGALLKVADQVKMEVSWSNKSGSVRSHFREILVIVNGTGRRLGAVRQLRYDDLLLDRDPHGAIRWRAETDKVDHETTVPIDAEVREAVETARKRPPVGGPLFPAPRDESQPVDRYLPRKWLRKAEDLADLDHEEGFGYHAFRRKWVIERKHLPDADVAKAGGWQSLQALRRAYQQPDEETMLKVVENSRELRERGR